MIILGLESSCDETAAGIVQKGSQVLASVVATQTQRHARFGGVVPEVAARAHLEAIDDVCNRALSEAGLNLSQIDAIATTQGPGLIGALLVSVSYAKGLAARSARPLVPVNHVHSHIHGALLDRDDPVAFPCFALVVSGGHTNLYLMRAHTDLELIAHSIDDACGECFDKVAKLMDLGYPGGPRIEEMAREGAEDSFELPRMMNDPRLVFSYSGLKTSMLNLLRREEVGRDRYSDACASFQKEALHQIVRKLRRASELHPGCREILIAGGVAANKRLRRMIDEETDLEAIFPNFAYCSDNGAMIAAHAYHKLHSSDDVSQFDWNTPWDAYSRYPFKARTDG